MRNPTWIIQAKLSTIPTVSPDVVYDQHHCGTENKNLADFFPFSPSYIDVQDKNLLLNHHFRKNPSPFPSSPKKFFDIFQSRLIHGIQEEGCPGILEMLTNKLKISTSIQPMMFNLGEENLPPKLLEKSQ